MRRGYYRIAFCAMAILSAVVVLLLLFNDFDFGKSEVATYIIGVLTITATSILGFATYVQTQEQIQMDKTEKMPFYEIASDEEDKDGNRYILKKSNCKIELKNSNENKVCSAKLFVSSEKVSYQKLNLKNYQMYQMYQMYQIYQSDECDLTQTELDKQKQIIKNYEQEIDKMINKQPTDVYFIYDKWAELDKQLVRDYRRRIRYLWLNLYVCFYNFNQKDYIKFRDDDSLTCCERKEILICYIKGSEKKLDQFLEYINREYNWNSIKYQTGTLWKMDYAMLADVNKLVYILDENANKCNCHLAVLVKTIYGYDYIQTIEIALTDTPDKKKFVISRCESRIISCRKEPKIKNGRIQIGQRNLSY